MTSLDYGLDVPYEVQLEYDAAISTLYMSVLESQRSPGQHATRHLLTPGVYMISLSYNGASEVTLQHLGGGVTNTVSVAEGTEGAPRTSAPIKISVQGTNEYLRVYAPSTSGTARATISVIPAATFDEMAESVQGVSVLSEISNLQSTKADKTTLDARVPANMSLRVDTSVGTRIFAGDTMIYGDTGWRNVTDLYLAESPDKSLEFGAGGGLFVRRTAEFLHVRLRGSVSTTAGSTQTNLFPAGWKASSSGSRTPLVFANANDRSAHFRTTSGDAYLIQRMVVGQLLVWHESATAVIPAERVWPSSLIGNPA